MLYDNSNRRKYIEQIDIENYILSNGFLISVQDLVDMTDYFITKYVDEDRSRNLIDNRSDSETK